MKKGTIFRNLWSRYEVYFVFLSQPAKTARGEARATRGYEIARVNGKWEMRTAQYYMSSLKDEAHFPVVGVVDLEQACIRESLKAIGRRAYGEDSVRALSQAD